MNDATAQFGMQLGHSAVAAGQDYVQRNVCRVTPMAGQTLMNFVQFSGIVPFSILKHHFNVSNSYVIKKIQLVLFPWFHKPWTRKIRRSEHGQSEWQPPREDINSPDLYIPRSLSLSYHGLLLLMKLVMALVTYILLAALQSGLKQRFHPRILGDSASKGLAVVVLDFFFVKIGCYFLNVQGTGQVVDLIAYGGYKFVG